MKTLEDAGVEPIEAVGQQFDPNLHNAVMHVEDEKYGENDDCHGTAEGLQVPRQRGTPQHGSGSKLNQLQNLAYYQKFV